MAKQDFQYYAIVESDYDGFSVSFPDIDGCFTCADSLVEAIYNAHEALEGHLEVLIFDSEDEHVELPFPSNPNIIDIPNGASLIPIKVTINYLNEDVDMDKLLLGVDYDEDDMRLKKSKEKQALLMKKRLGRNRGRRVTESLEYAYMKK